MSTYLETYPNTLTSGTGLIQAITELATCPWGEDVTSTILEQTYAVRSSFKELSPTFESLTPLTRPNIIATMFFQKWAKLYEDFKLEYNPLTAYKVVETGNNSKETESDDTTTYGKTRRNVTDDIGTVNTTNTGNDSTNNSVYGFNSTSPVPSDNSSGNSSETSLETRDLNTESTQTDGGSDTINRTGIETIEHTVTKEGNIGYSSPQELIRQEFEIWSRPFFDIVFTDIDNFITIQVY